MKKIIVALSLVSLGGALTLGEPSSPEVVAPAIPASVEYSWPSGVEVPVLRPFAPGAQNWNAGHRGVDLALGAGQPVYAAADGRVIYAGTLNDRELVSIEHADGIRTTYEPVSPRRRARRRRLAWRDYRARGRRTLLALLLPALGSQARPGRLPRSAIPAVGPYPPLRVVATPGTGPGVGLANAI
ncbi:M23 family metallopeptidase [Trueperella sp.]|uniref:M23 family metallopeptidase n=1 Tax=Trueperella sp. TaxID=2699835 RepID=UPI0026072EE0|nr:M23 family metallopeptidase [Trueperella sp.]